MISFSIGANSTGAYRSMPSHESQCALAYTPEQLFDLAADVECYPEFLPWWIAARVRKREGNIYFTDQVIGFGVFRERFGSRTVLRRPERIEVTSTDGMFRNFDLTWRFDPLPGGGCRVALLVNLELRSNLVQDLFHRVILRSAGSIMSAFEARAHQLYDPRRVPV
jgi:coenzyme Q-binding protein COQ10